MKTTVTPPPDSNCAAALRAVLPDAATASVISDIGSRSSSSTRKFFHAVRVFVSSIVDNSAFQDVSVRRQVLIIFTSNGPLIYRWDTNNDVRDELARSPRK
jgi:hypothetical protein